MKIKAKAKMTQFESCQASPTLHEHRHPAANGAWGVPLYTADFGLRSNQKSHALWPNTHALHHVGDSISVEMFVYIPQNVPKPQKESKSEKSKFDPSRIRTVVSGVIDTDIRPFNL